MTCEPPCSLKACSVIRFYGRAVLSPLVGTDITTDNPAEVSSSYIYSKLYLIAPYWLWFQQGMQLA